MILSVWKGETQSRDAVTVTIGEDEGQSARVSPIRTGWLESVTDELAPSLGFYRTHRLCWLFTEEGERILMDSGASALDGPSEWANLLSFELAALRAADFTC